MKLERVALMPSQFVGGWTPWASLPLRVLVGIAFIAHGWPKLLGMAAFTEGFAKMGIPAPGLMLPLVMILEVAGGVALALGLLTRWVALGFVIEMLVTTFYVRIPAGHKFLLGYELDLVYLTAAIFFLLAGPGRFSLDRKLGFEA